MANNSSGIVSKIWTFCNTLQDDGVGYGDYLEQLTYLLFPKLQRASPPMAAGANLPTTKSLPVTKPASTLPGCRDKACLVSTQLPDLDVLAEKL